MSKVEPGGPENYDMSQTSKEDHSSEPESKVHPKTIGKRLESTTLCALKRCHEIGLVRDYGRLPTKDEKPDVAAEAKPRDPDPAGAEPLFAWLMGKEVQVEIETKNWGRSLKRRPHPLWGKYNLHDADEIRDRIVQKAWTVDEERRILVISEMSEDILTPNAIYVLKENFYTLGSKNGWFSRIVEVGHQIQADSDVEAIQTIYEDLLRILTIMLDEA